MPRLDGLPDLLQMSLAQWWTLPYRK